MGQHLFFGRYPINKSAVVAVEVENLEGVVFLADDAMTPRDRGMVQPNRTCRFATNRRLFHRQRKRRSLSRPVDCYQPWIHMLPSLKPVLSRMPLTQVLSISSAISTDSLTSTFDIKTPAEAFDDIVANQ